jgi:hypothetical protein
MSFFFHSIQRTIRRFDRTRLQGMYHPYCAECLVTRVLTIGYLCAACVKSTGRKNDRTGEKRFQRKELAKAYAASNRKELLETSLTRSQMFTFVEKASDAMNIQMDKLLIKRPSSYHIISIAQVSESWTGPSPNGVRTGRSIEQELQEASLTHGRNDKMTAALVRLVTIGNTTYFEKLTTNEAKQMGGSTHTIYSGNNPYICRQVEKFCQCEIVNRERTGFRFRLLQSTPGAGDLSGGPPFKVGIRFIECNRDWVPFDGHSNSKLMTSVVFRDDIDRTIPHISQAMESQSAVEDEESKPAAKKAPAQAVYEDDESKPAAKKAPATKKAKNGHHYDITNYCSPYAIEETEPAAKNAKPDAIKESKPAAKKAPTALNNISNYFSK